MHKRLQEIDQEIAEEQARIDRSFAGENEYVGSETMGIRGSNTRIERLQQEKAELEADEFVGIETKPEATPEETVAIEKTEQNKFDRIQAKMERKRQSMKKLHQPSPQTTPLVGLVPQVNIKTSKNLIKVHHKQFRQLIVIRTYGQSSTRSVLMRRIENIVLKHMFKFV